MLAADVGQVGGLQQVRDGWAIFFIFFIQLPFLCPVFWEMAEHD